MADQATTPTTKEITVAGVAFDISMPFAEGHVCTAAQARALNQTRSENIRNNFAPRVKKAKGDAAEVPADALKALGKEFKTYEGEYKFTMASGTSRVTDPLEKETLSVARALFVGKLKEAGIMVKDYDAEKMAEKVAEVAEMPEVIAQAKKRLAERAKIAETQISVSI